MKDIEELTVGDAMTRGCICVDLNETVREAAEVMKKNDISGVIVTRSGEGVGIVTERDIICNIVAIGNNPETTEVQKIMTAPLITIAPDATIDDAARLMRDKDIRRIVVMDAGKIIGIISEFDIVKIEPAMHILIQEQYKWHIGDASASDEGQLTGVCDSCENYSDALKMVDGRLLCDECG